jgi:integrase/recombinase XerD
LLTLFLNDRHTRGVSQRTHVFYDGYMAKYLLSMKQNALTVTKPVIAAFIDGLSCSPGGKAAYFRVIRAFYRWAMKDGLIEKNPMQTMKAPKVPKPLRHTISLDSLPMLLDACISVRDKLIVSMFADTGLRLSELADIKARDIDQGARTIKIRAKDCGLSG